MASDVPQPVRSGLLDLTGLPAPVIKSITQLVESLRQEIASSGRTGTTCPPTPLRGRFADLKLTIPREDLDEAQRESWENFPREFPEPGPS
jgi:hypothetical protein